MYANAYKSLDFELLCFFDLSARREKPLQTNLAASESAAEAFAAREGAPEKKLTDGKGKEEEDIGKRAQRRPALGKPSQILLCSSRDKRRSLLLSGALYP